MAQTLDLVVDGSVLLDISVRMGDVGLGLVVVVITDEILHGVFREKLLELAAELGRQGLVVGQHQGGTVEPGDDVCHGEGLAGAGDAQQHLLLQAVFQAKDQVVNGLRLVAGGPVIRDELESIHHSLRTELFMILYHVRFQNTR